MTIQDLLAQAAQCNSDADACALVSELTAAFKATPAFAELGSFDPVAAMADGKAYASLQFNRVHSTKYVTTLRPTIHNGQLFVEVSTAEQRDVRQDPGLPWEVVRGLDYFVNPYPGDSIDRLAERAKQRAIDNYVELLGTVGIEGDLAKEVASRAW